MRRHDPMMDSEPISPIDTSRELEIGRDWKKSIALVAISLGLAALFAFGMQIEPDGYRETRFRDWSYLLLPAFLALAGWGTYRLFAPRGAPVRLRPDGFVDLRAGKRTIPWTEVRNVARHGNYIYLTLRLAYARRYSFTLSQRLVKSRRSNAGPSHLLLTDWCLAESQSRLLELINAYWTAHGKS